MFFNMKIELKTPFSQPYACLPAFYRSPEFSLFHSIETNFYWVFAHIYKQSFIICYIECLCSLHCCSSEKHKTYIYGTGRNFQAEVIRLIFSIAWLTLTSTRIYANCFIGSPMLQQRPQTMLKLNTIKYRACTIALGSLTLSLSLCR